MIRQFPYLHIQKKCILEVEYSINSDPVTSGFEIVKDLIPDLNICIGYPTIHAYVKEHEGFGFTRYCGFIQIVEINNIKETVKIVDTPPVFQEKKIPFFSYGYPAEAYDAPVNSYGMGKEIIWCANTYLVDMPSYVNGNQIRYLTGFTWGFQERSDKIEISQLKELSQIDWRYDVEFLKHEYNEWSFM